MGELVSLKLKEKGLKPAWLARQIDFDADIYSKYCLGYHILDTLKVVNEWQKVTCQFDLGKNFYKGDVVKIFLYNTSNTIIYCDDIHVVFQYE